MSKFKILSIIVSILVPVVVNAYLPTSNDTTATIDEDQSFIFSAAHIPYNDPDGDIIAGILITAIETNGDLENNTIDVENGTVVSTINNLVFLPDPDENGFPYTSFWFRVIDSSDDTSSVESPYAFIINIIPVNDAPVFSSLPNNITVNEGFSGTQTVTVTPGDVPADESDQTVIYSLSPSSVTFATVVINSNNGAVSVDAVGDSSGNEIFTITADDGGGTANGGVETSTQTFSLTVNPVNDAPSFTTGSDEDVLEDSGLLNAHTVTDWATSISSGPPDESGQTLSFNVSNDNNSLFSVQPAISSSGDLTYTLAEHANGTAEVIINLSDNGGVSNGGVNQSEDQTFNINVTSINDAPVFSSLPNNITVNEGFSGTQTVT
ncbi:MAG: hypothetical protein HOM08_12470, partial [Candidatus Marinimicrobia bacterium]|nr:hypothetical protein [Candidatus Neomarinimicrobiota bacterium]